ncbi:hypothetical protein PV08_03553 [Exophiala spinifera]|uniref:Uncharacterized protein n=1 Tax=Exophiala spinifera TaxID=91928 RepID=A0A0D2C6P9_9EURO|nr:uncharacterized protein PV08_03553 [Exophiala spinifera]KIW19259.1 hypothetical protein PV08_03553 [Exophiala spinifera]
MKRTAERPTDRSSKRSSIHDEHEWIIRGYRPDLANAPQSPDEDPLGEIAYHRAFTRISAQTPGRVPNPSFFPNSPTALQFMKWKDQILFSPKPAGDRTPTQKPTPVSQAPTTLPGNLPSPGYSEDPPKAYRSLSEDQARTGDSGSSTQGAVIKTQPRSPPPPVRLRIDQTRPQPHHQPAPMTNILPPIMEPRINAAPPGPDKVFR